jgi:transposase
VRALVAVIAELARQTDILQGEVEAGFGRHPDAEIYLSQPGLGTILAARVLAEFGDDPHRYPDPRARKNYSGMAPVTKASGKSRVVLARHARNRRLADALYQQAFSALTASPGARAYYDTRGGRGATHHQALRALANHLVGILHGCLHRQRRYDEATAWPNHAQTCAASHLPGVGCLGGPRDDRSVESSVQHRGERQHVQGFRL